MNLESTTSYGFVDTMSNKPFKEKFNKNIPFFTVVDFFQYNEYVADIIYKNSLTIIDGSQDPHDIIQLHDKLILSGLIDKTILLTSNYDDYSSYKNIFYFPYQLYRSKVKLIQHNIEKNRKYKISCLNRNPHTHKIYTFFKLQQLENFNDMLVSFNNIIPHTGKVLTFDDYILSVIPAQIREEIRKINLHKSIPGDDLYNWQELLNNNHPAYNDSYLNIITETTYDLRCMSEKTFKPLVSGQLFLFSSAPKSLNFLSDLGFEIYDNCIDTSYDRLDNMYERIDKMIDTVSLIYDDIEDIYFENKDKLFYNQNRMQSNELGMLFLQPLIEIGVIS